MRGALQQAAGLYQHKDWRGRFLGTRQMFACVKNKGVCVEGRGQVRQGGDKSQGWVCTMERTGIGVLLQTGSTGRLPPRLLQPGQITALDRRLGLHLSTPVLEIWDHSSSPLNYLLFPRLGGNRVEGRGFGGKLMAANSLLKEKRNVLWMLCRA